MKNKSAKRQHKKKQREKRLIKERNARRNAPDSVLEGDSQPRDEPSDPRRLNMDPERALRAAHRDVTSRDFSSLEGLQQRVEGLAGRNLAELAREALALGGVEAAQELAYQALEAPSLPRALALATKALEFDPHCCDALTLVALGRHSEPAPLIEALEHAVRCGAERLGEERLRGEERGRFGAIVDARPYLRARSQLFGALWRADRCTDALEHARELIALDSGDRSGVRRTLLGLLLESSQLDEARALIERFGEDDSPTFVWGAVLETFLRAGAREAKDVLLRARRFAPFFEHALLEAELPEDSEHAEAFADLGKAWITHGPAFEWLAAGAPLSTPAERDALCASFAPPVAALLELGPPELYVEWPDYVATHGFTAEHVPELLRLLAVPELDDYPAESPRVWASLYVTRVLGQLRSAAAIEPLIEFSRRHHDDEWLNLEIVFELIGPAAIDALVRWLRLPALSEYEHMTPVDALGRLARAHPTERARVSSELAAVLLQFDQRAPQLNALLCDALFALDATSHRVLVAQVLDSGRFDASVVDDLEALEAWAGPPVGD